MKTRVDQVEGAIDQNHRWIRRKARDDRVDRGHCSFALILSIADRSFVRSQIVNWDLKSVNRVELDDASSSIEQQRRIAGAILCRWQNCPVAFIRRGDAVLALCTFGVLPESADESIQVMLCTEARVYQRERRSLLLSIKDEVTPSATKTGLSGPGRFWCDVNASHWTTRDSTSPDHDH
jgi:hypothetical protein